MDIVIIGLTLVLGGGMSAVLFMGKGSFLIAGYNTASEEEKRKYDEKKLCRATGSYLAVLTFLVLGAEIMGENIPNWYTGLLTAGIIVGTIFFLIYANLGCRAKIQEGEIPATKSPEDIQREKKHQKLRIFLAVLFTAAVLAGTGILLFAGDVKVAIQDESLYIKGSFWEDYELSLSEIRSITYREDFQVGEKLYGVNSVQLNEGTFQNKEFGKYTIYSYARCKSFVVIETGKRELVVNGKTPEETRELYQKLLEAAEIG